MATILIVDDHGVHRSFLFALLGDEHHRLLEAVDGQEALLLAAAERPDLIITDIMMPRMDGNEFSMRLRRDPALASIPIIFYTSSYSTPEAEAMAKACGVHCVLQKPSPPQRIIAAVYEALCLPVPELGLRGVSEPPRTSRFAAIDPANPSDARTSSGSQPVPGVAQTVESRLEQSLVDFQALGSRLTALIDMGIELASERNPQRLIESGCRIARHTGVAKFSVAAIAAADGNGYTCFSTRGVRPEVHEWLASAARPEGIFEAARVTRRAQRMHGLRGDVGAAGLPVGHPAVDSVLVAPIASAGHDYGWIYLCDKLGGDRFSDIDEEVLAAVAAQVAVAYENMLLYENVQRNLGQLEREMVARRQMAEQLQLREAGLQRAQQLSRLAHVVTAPDGSFISWSSSLPGLLGIDSAAMPSSTREWLRYVHPADRDRFRDCCIAAGRSGMHAAFDYRVKRGEGQWMQVHQVLEPLPGTGAPDGKMRWFNTMQDITEQREQQDKLTRLSRLYAMQSGINSAIVRIHERQPLLREVARVAVEAGAFSMAWVGLVGERSVDGRIINWMENPASGETAALILAAVRIGDAHPACQAARALRLTICNDIEAEPVLAAVGHEWYRDGHRAMANVPLIVNGRAVAVLSLYAAEVGFFNTQEQVLLEELGADLSFGLSFIEKEEQLNFLAYYDVLTGLPNRSLFSDRLAQTLRERQQSLSDACVVLLNVSRFAQINDAFGRNTGDAVLRMVAQRLSSAQVDCVSVARMSGDTFALVLGGVTQGGSAAACVERAILDPLEAVFLFEGRELNLSVRAGLAVYPNDGADAETLMQHAELALNSAKSNGLRVSYYAPQMNAANAARIELESALRAALAEQQFVLHYQPRVDLVSGRIVSAEALIRWQHPRRGLVPPVQFIALCEETGLIVPIGAWVIDAVCAQQAAWRREGVEIVPVAVNLSALQFKRGGLMETIAQTTARHGLEQKYLEFELTESILMDDPEQAIRDLQALKLIGAELSLDDFGTGYSSLAYLQRFPFDFVKIDRSFVTNVATSPADAAIVSAVIAMAHSLNLKVVAEGVETEGQLRLLRRLHCDQLQGYYFSAAVAATEFCAMLREERSLEFATIPTTRQDTLLVVDDEPNNLSALNRLLRREGYRVLLARSGQEGLALLALNDVQVVVTDQRMPAMSGTQFLAIVKELYPETIRIILSGYTDLEVVTNGVNQGAVFKFLTKPWDDDLLRGHIREAFRYYHPRSDAVLIDAPA